MEKLETVKSGTVIKNGGMTLTVICLAENGGKNLALLIRHEDGMFITVRQLGFYQGNYTWCWGHYFPDLTDALKDYKTRFNEL